MITGPLLRIPLSSSSPIPYTLFFSAYLTICIVCIVRDVAHCICPCYWAEDRIATPTLITIVMATLEDIFD